MYRFSRSDLTNLQGEVSSLSSVNLIYFVAGSIGIIQKPPGIEYKKESDPDPFRIPDNIMGYSALPGEYTHTYFRKNSGQQDWQSLKTKVTINEDGSRWTGNVDDKNGSTVYIFGDSFVFGSGVNDEQTFSYLLQQALPNSKVKLFAFGGYSLTQAYKRFEMIKDTIKSSDIIVLGYADFYDERHVMSPTRVRKINNWILKRNPGILNIDYSLLKASLKNNNSISFSYVKRDCTKNDSYCEKPDPSSSYMTKTTASLINNIAGNTGAKVYLLHFFGDSKNPVFNLIRNDVVRISALPKDFDYFIRDDIEGFDPHAGPYWHYAISRKLLKALSNPNDP
jgi:hypothetical protein